MKCVILKTRHFHRWAKKAGLLDKALLAAVSEMINGLIDADLGGGILKKTDCIAGAGEEW